MISFPFLQRDVHFKLPHALVLARHQRPYILVHLLASHIFQYFKLCHYLIQIPNAIQVFLKVIRFSGAINKFRKLNYSP